MAPTLIPAQADGMIRAYKFMREKWAVEAVRTGRLKISEFKELNDPFELLGNYIPNVNLREILVDNLTKRFGLLCFSRTWQETLLWSHYAEQHRGVALGFDLRESTAYAPRYVDTLNRWISTSALGVKTLRKLLSFINACFSQNVTVGSTRTRCECLRN